MVLLRIKLLRCLPGLMFCYVAMLKIFTQSRCHIICFKMFSMKIEDGNKRGIQIFTVVKQCPETSSRRRILALCKLNMSPFPHIKHIVNHMHHVTHVQFTHMCQIQKIYLNIFHWNL